MSTVIFLARLTLRALYLAVIVAIVRYLTDSSFDYYSTITLCVSKIINSYRLTRYQPKIKRSAEGLRSNCRTVQDQLDHSPNDPPPYPPPFNKKTVGYILFTNCWLEPHTRLRLI